MASFTFRDADYPYLPASNQASVTRCHDTPAGNAFATGAVTESQQVEQGSGDHYRPLSETRFFAEFYGSRKSENPVIALLASWIRVVPRGFRRLFLWRSAWFLASCWC